ncbi:MAG: GNAT family N-acetyltransferase [Rhabdochlamydiaceae bacterium]|nr:GNAT family N-acetyltransferase [Candidatus Amphrikana amoebophyrae]
MQRMTIAPNPVSQNFSQFLFLDKIFFSLKVATISILCISVLIKCFIKWNQPPPSKPKKDDVPSSQFSAEILTVETVNKAKWPEVIEIMNIWIKKSNDFYRDIHNNDLNSMLRAKRLKNDPAEIFVIATHIYCSIERCLKAKRPLTENSEENWDTVLVCRDRSTKIQAIALHDQENNKLAYLATHPNNLKHVKTKKTRTKGAGSKIMLHLISLSLKLNRALLLDSTDIAKEFYKRFGFEVIRTRYYYCDPMKLTMQTVKNLIQSKSPVYRNFRYA